MKTLYSPWLILVVSMLWGGGLRGQVILSEFMASNTSGLRDQDGDPSDWIELYNVGTAPVNLSGWHLTDDAANLTKWTLPTTSLDPGKFLLIFASGKNRSVAGLELHANFQLDGAGEYLGLVRPDGKTVESAFSPRFPAQENDISFGTISTVARTVLFTEEKNFSWRVPMAASDYPAAWKNTNYDDSGWATGVLPAGFDAGQISGGTSGTTNLARGRLATQSSTTGSFVAGLATDGNLNNYTHTVAGQNLPATWEVHLGTNAWIEQVILHNRAACCGSRLRDITVHVLSVDGKSTNFTSALLNPENALGGGSLNGPADLAVNLVTLTGAPVSGGRVRVIRTPDPDLSGTGGQGNVDEADVLSMGEVEVIGSTLPPNFRAIVKTDLGAAMRGVNATALLRIPFAVSLDDIPFLDSLTLRMRYDDGFVAYLNGAKVVAKNAPGVVAWNSSATAEHPDLAALQFEEFDLTPYLNLLQDGVNLLAIQGLNQSAADDDFLVSAELYGASVVLSSGQYFTRPTPRTNNVPGTIGLVADTKFSVNRGFFTVPFTVAITTATAGAEIRFTTNGSAPSAVNGFIYSGPITISRTTVVRAIATKSGYTPTEVDTQT